MTGAIVGGRSRILRPDTPSMEVPMAGVEARAFDSPDETRTPDKTRVEIESGRMHVTHDDGTELEIGPGQTYVIEPVHEAPVVGNEPLLGFEFESATAEEFARG